VIVDDEDLQIEMRETLERSFDGLRFVAAGMTTVRSIAFPTLELRSARTMRPQPLSD